MYWLRLLTACCNLLAACADGCWYTCAAACRSIAPRAVANDNDTAANLTFVNCAFVSNIYNTFECDSSMGWSCYFTGPPGAAGLSTVSNAVLKGRTIFRNNTWGAVYVASPVTVAFQGSLEVSGNTKNIGNPFGRRRLHRTADAAAAADVMPAVAAPQTAVPQDGAANGPTYGAGIFASGGARLTFAGVSTFTGNTGIGGCGIMLDNATAFFAPTKAVQFIGNSAPTTDGSGMALRAIRNSSVVFRGPVVMADNWARSGAGGAIFLDNSNLTFHDVATLRNNSIVMGPGMVGYWLERGCRCSCTLCMQHVEVFQQMNIGCAAAICLPTRDERRTTTW
jgi:hypothetical protein